MEQTPSPDTPTPLLHPSARGFLADPSRIDDLLERHGSPLHVVFPTIFAENVRKYREVLRRIGTPAHIFFALKATSSDVFTKVAALLKIGVDVSSVEELADGLRGGVPGDALTVNGPTKSDALLALSLQHRSTIVADSMRELEDIVALRRLLDVRQPTDILLRVQRAGEQGSRFGMPIEHMEDALGMCETQKNALALRGFAQHCGFTSLDERVRSARMLIDQVLRARATGLPASTINIGGGFPVNYVSGETWHTSSIHGSVREFRGHVPYTGERVQWDFLQDMIDAPYSPRQRIAEILREQDIGFSIEPGRSVLHQAGITAMRVRGTKELADQAFVEVEGNMHALSGFLMDLKHASDPLLMTRHARQARPFRAYVMGNTCLERDMPCPRPVAFPSRPERDDILVFANTEGYFSNAAAVEFHRIPKPQRLAVLPAGNGAWHVKTDDRCELVDIARVLLADNGTESNR